MGTTRIRRADAAGIAEAARLLVAGELVAFPTETVYGLGADAASARAVARLFTAKGRPSSHPVIVHLASADQIGEWTMALPAAAQALARRFWPGPLTLILPRGPRVIDAVTGGQPSVGIRVPSHPVAHALLAAFGGGVAAPSANRFGRVSPTSAVHVECELGDAVTMILDGGECEVGIESTIVDFTSAGGRAVLLRPGGVDLAEISQALGYVPLPPGNAAPRASGTLAAHYAPATAALRVPRALLQPALQSALGEGRRVAVLTLGEPATALTGAALVRRGATDPRAYARALYRNLRELDAAGVELIVIEAPPDSAEWAAVNDRLRRATHRAEEPFADDDAPARGARHAGFLATGDGR